MGIALLTISAGKQGFNVTISGQTVTFDGPNQSQLPIRVTFALRKVGQSQVVNFVGTITDSSGYNTRNVRFDNVSGDLRAGPFDIDGSAIHCYNPD
jgi:hypothetical protein